jgi:hypothetical protein
MHADFVIHPDLGFETSPTPAFFEQARLSGEVAARRLLPGLQAAMAAADPSGGRSAGTGRLSAVSD